VTTISHSNVAFTDPTCVLLPPCDRNPVAPRLLEKIIACLSTRFDLSAKDIRPHLRSASLSQYGKIRRLDGGDLMNASALVGVGDDRRNATFVRVSCIFESDPSQHY
jgi:hypothetical protein